MGNPRTIFFTVSNDLVTDQRMIRIATSFSKQGWEVTLVGREKPNSPPLRNQVFSQIRLKLPFHKGPLFYFFLNWALWRYLHRQPKNAIIASVDLDTLPAGWLIKKNDPHRWFYEAHEYFPEVPELQDRPIIKQCWLLLERFFIKRVLYLSTVSESVAQHFKTLYPHLETIVARNFPFQRSHQPIQNREHKIVLYQGDLNEGRGLELAIDAMADFENLFLFIAGDGYLKESLQKLIDKSKAANRIKLLGRIYPDELKAITDQAWIGINTLENKGLNYYYSLANKFGDYLQAGLPQINMNYPEYRLLNNPPVSELMENYTKEDLIKAIENLMNEDYYITLVKNALNLRDKYNWEIEADRMINWYESRIE